MNKKVKRVAVTGAAGQIAYSLIFRIASGELFGSHQPVALHLLEVPQVEHALKGVAMELYDCASPVLHDVVYGTDPKHVFKDVDWALLVGATPRTKGMERNDLLTRNAPVFIEQGRALNEVGASGLQVLVVGNPCNTNAWITMKCAPNIDARNFHAMTRLDQNRAAYQLAKKASTQVSEVDRALIWGNHSSTQVPDILNTRISQNPVQEMIQDTHWLENEFFEILQQRGAAIIEARGKSSAASAANAILEAVKSLEEKTPSGEFYSDCVHSLGNPYGIDEDLIFSFPCESQGEGKWDFVHGLKLDTFLKEKLEITQEELIKEREFVKKLI